MVWLLPQLQHLLPEVLPPPELPAEQSRQLLFNAIARLTAREAESRLVVLVLEDLHWANEGTLLLLNLLAKLTPRIRLWIIGTYRDFKLQEGALNWLRGAVEVARRQNAKSLELRAALSLARVLQMQHKKTEARGTFKEVYRFFSEGV